jgi:hypothetical protein
MCFDSRRYSAGCGKEIEVETENHPAG